MSGLPHLWRAGQSGNPGGRPRGISRTKLMSRLSDEVTPETLAAMVVNPAGPEAQAWSGRADGLSPRELSAARWALQVAEGVDRAREAALDREEGSVAQVMRHELSAPPSRSPAEIIQALQRDQAPEAQTAATLALPGPSSEPAPSDSPSAGSAGSAEMLSDAEIAARAREEERRYQAERRRTSLDL